MFPPLPPKTLSEKMTVARRKIARLGNKRNTVYSLLTDTSVKRTLRVWSLPFFTPYSLYLTLYKTDISLRRTHTAGPQGVRLRKS